MGTYKPLVKTQTLKITIKQELHKNNAFQIMMNQVKRKQLNKNVIL